MFRGFGTTTYNTLQCSRLAARGGNKCIEEPHFLEEGPFMYPNELDNDGGLDSGGEGGDLGAEPKDPGGLVERRWLGLLTCCHFFLLSFLVLAVNLSSGNIARRKSNCRLKKWHSQAERRMSISVTHVRSTNNMLSIGNIENALANSSSDFVSDTVSLDLACDSPLARSIRQSLASCLCHAPVT